MADQEHSSNKLPSQGFKLESILVEVDKLSSTQIRTLVEALHSQHDSLKANASTEELNRIARLENHLQAEYRQRAERSITQDHNIGQRFKI